MQKVQKTFDNGVHTISYSNSSGSTIAAGAIVVIAKKAWIALSAIADGEEGIVARENFSCELDAKTTEAFTQMQPLYYNSGLTGTGTSASTFVGYAEAAKATATATARVIVGLERPNGES